MLDTLVIYKSGTGCHSVKNTIEVMPQKLLSRGVQYALTTGMHLVLQETNRLRNYKYDSMGKKLIFSGSVSENLETEGGNFDVTLNISCSELPSLVEMICDVWEKKEQAKIHLKLIDLAEWKASHLSKYEATLAEIREIIETCVSATGYLKKINVITDRLFLQEMSNCGAGEQRVTLAPDGQFWVCANFFHAKLDFACVGNLDDGIDEDRLRLYELDYSPICRVCDAFHCKRCVFLNYIKTMEVNIPSQMQCLVAHAEREQSRLLGAVLGQLQYKDKIVIIEKRNYSDPYRLLPIAKRVLG